VIWRRLAISTLVGSAFALGAHFLVRHAPKRYEATAKILALPVLASPAIGGAANPALRAAGFDGVGLGRLGEYTAAQESVRSLPRSTSIRLEPGLVPGQTVVVADAATAPASAAAANAFVDQVLAYRASTLHRLVSEQSASVDLLRRVTRHGRSLPSVVADLDGISFLARLHGGGASAQRAPVPQRAVSPDQPRDVSAAGVLGFATALTLMAAMRHRGAWLRRRAR
jgi:hypothetical protein